MVGKPVCDNYEVRFSMSLVSASCTAFLIPYPGEVASSSMRIGGFLHGLCNAEPLPLAPRKLAASVTYGA